MLLLDMVSEFLAAISIKVTYRTLQNTKGSIIIISVIKNAIDRNIFLTEKELKKLFYHFQFVLH